MKIIVIGAVAAGTSAAAKARRNDDEAEITIYEKDYDISYSGCGLPYFIGNEIKSIDELTPRDSAFFKKKYNIDVKTRKEVLELKVVEKKLIIKDLETEEIFEDAYDKLVLATGARPFVPKVEGISKKHVFFLRTVQDALKIRAFIRDEKPKDAVIAGSGFIGFEMLENLLNYEMDVTLVEMMDKITPNLDEDMACYLRKQLEQEGAKISTGTKIVEIKDNEVISSHDEILKADLVIMATGVRPNVDLASNAGIELGVTGAIKVNDDMSTSNPDIYACGDCAESFSRITKKAIYRPLGSTANKMGRIAGDALTGGSLRYQGNLSTGIFKIFDLTVGSTGLSEKEAREEGYNIVVNHNIKPDRPFYYYGEELIIKGIANQEDGKLLGVQVIGKHGVDKRIDVFATLITYGAKVEELFHIDLGYAPPFSTTKDPVHYTGMILDNAINRGRDLITSEEIRGCEEDIQIVDARSQKDYEKKGHVEAAVNMPHAKLREQMKELDPNKKTVTYCNKGVTGNAAQNILMNHGFKDVKNLSGGHRFYKGTEK
jgi:NADPH-dependent 2,4-dienoyl-CoA reductase/sulfur reductase-like enzyme/rhodanese-related sulfurtransferase